MLALNRSWFAVRPGLPAAGCPRPPGRGAKDFRVVSGPSPFAAGCPGPHDDQAITGHELEPAITVNPANPRNIVATWKQDVGPEQSRGDLVGSSLDDGRTWTRSTIPGPTPHGPARGSRILMLPGDRAAVHRTPNRS